MSGMVGFRSVGRANPLKYPAPSKGYRHRGRGGQRQFLPGTGICVPIRDMNDHISRVFLTAILASGCNVTVNRPDDGSTSDNASTSGDSSSGGPLGTTAGVESSSSSSNGADGESSTSSSSDDSGSSSSGNTCEPTATYAAHWPPADECHGECQRGDLPLAVSGGGGMTLSMCSPTCSVASDCPPHPLGEVACVMGNRCALPCDDGTPCPDDHECQLLGGGFPRCIPFAL